MRQSTDWLAANAQFSPNESFFFSAEKQRKSQEGRQLTLTLILVCGAFLVLASPIFTLLTVFTFVDPLASPRRFANFNLMRGIFEQVGRNVF